MDARVIRHLKRNAEMLEHLQKVVLEHAKIIRSGLVPNNSASALKQNFDVKLPPHLRPGNLGDLNAVIWPFWFTLAPTQDVGPNGNVRTSVTVTQEAAFILMSITKTVYEKTGPNYAYLDPEQPSTAFEASGLSLAMKDAQSTRVFQNLPIDTDHLGHPQHPTILPTPVFFLPRASIEIEYFNTDAARTYRPFTTLFGYRVRLDDAQNTMSTVTYR